MNNGKGARLKACERAARLQNGNVSVSASARAARQADAQRATESGTAARWTTAKVQALKRVRVAQGCKLWHPVSQCECQPQGRQAGRESRQTPPKRRGQKVTIWRWLQGRQAGREGKARGQAIKGV